MGFKYQKQSQIKHELIEVKGSVYDSDVHRLSVLMDDVKSRGRSMALDLSQTKFLSSAALGLLVVTAKMLEQDGRRLSLVNPSTSVQQVIDDSNLGGLLRKVNQ